MRKVLIGEFGPILRLGLTELLVDEGCELVAEETSRMPLLERLAATVPEVVLFDLDDPPAPETIRAVGEKYPSVRMIGISAMSSLLRVYDPSHQGGSYTTEFNPEQLIQAVSER